MVTSNVQLCTRNISLCLCFVFSDVQVYGGMRGMKGLVYETSVLDPEEVSNQLFKNSTKHQDCRHSYSVFFWFFFIVNTHGSSEIRWPFKHLS